MRRSLPWLVLLSLSAGCAASKSDSGNTTETSKDPRLRYIGQTVVSEEVVDGTITTRTYDSASGPMCMRGDDYRVSTRDTGSANLVIFLQGGGACWDEFCLAVTGAPAGVPTVDILNPDLPENPVADWNVTYLPYCDGSLFIGDRDHDDDGDGTPDRFHRGLANLSAALDMARDQFGAPDHIALVGSSGGGFGVLLAPPIVRAVFPNARVSVFADSAVGVARGDAEPDYVSHLIDQWGAADLLPPTCDDGCIDNGHMTGIVAENLRVDDGLRMAVFTSWYDLIIGDVFLQVAAADFAADIEAETGALHAEFPDRYQRFIIDGRMHTTLLGDPSGIIGTDFGAVEVPPDALEDFSGIELGRLATTAAADGTEVAAWLSAFLSGDQAHWTDVVDPAGAAP